jgi:hypothetical protein
VANDCGGRGWPVAMLKMATPVSGHVVRVCAATCKPGRWPPAAVATWPRSTDLRAPTASPYQGAATAMAAVDPCAADPARSNRACALQADGMGALVAVREVSRSAEIEDSASSAVPSNSAGGWFAGRVFTPVEQTSNHMYVQVPGGEQGCR